MSTKPAQKKRGPAPKKRARRKPYTHVHISVFLLIIGGLVSALVGIGLGWFLLLDIPDIRSIDDYRPQVATTILDRKGKPIDAVYNQYRIVIPLEKMPTLLPKAFVAAEDSRYWEHPGLDIWSIFRAAINNIRSGRRSQGGSTITQQVTRSLMLSREKSYSRKLTEAILSYRLSKVLSKEEILYIYLNEIYLGEGAYGVEAAARVYFGKPASKLTLAETAVLAGLPQAPSRYSPLKHSRAAKERQRYVLNRLAEDKIISAQTARKAYKQKLAYLKAGARQATNGYFTQYVREKLIKQYGNEALFKEGLTVTTTLDSGLQRRAIDAIRSGSRAVAERQGNGIKPQGALLALDAGTGKILAMAGGTDFRTSPFNRAVNAKRQPGSSFKPLIYATAFEQGISPKDIVIDAPLSIRNRDGSHWTPKNFDKKYHGRTTLADSLIHSRNIVAIKLLQTTGMKPVLNLAKKAGITSTLQPDLTLALGSSPVSLLEMTAAYAPFAASGVYREPVAITAVHDRYGNKLPWPKQKAVQVISKKTATTMHRLLKLTVEKGTGMKARGIDGAAGKTGTSNNGADAWFIGFSGRLLTGVWFGHDRNGSLGKNESGGQTAAPVWRTFMKSAGF